MENLLPCPFCGGEAKLEDWSHVWEYGTIIKCVVCGACMSEGLEDGNGWHERAVEKWNRRAQPEPPEAVHGQWIEHVEPHYAFDECSMCHATEVGQSNYCPNCGAKMKEAR